MPDSRAHGIDHQALWHLLRHAAEAFVLVDEPGTIRFANDTAHRLFGWPPGELEGRSVEELVPAPLRAAHVDSRRGYHQNPAARPMGQRMELFACRRDGSRFPVRIGLSYVRADGETLVLAVVIDTSELKHAQESLLEYTRALERSNRDLEQFASVASHDLQEPLRKIQAFGERLRELPGEPLGERGRDYLERMLAAAGRMSTLIEDLLTYSRVTTRAQPFGEVDLNETIRGVLSDLELKLEQSGGKVEVAPLPRIEADPTQMRQLLQNLLQNALKFTRPGVAPLVRVEGEVVPGPPRALRLSVIDNGIGFEPRYQERIFNLFQRLHPRGAYQGSGIGLAICRKIADRHAGRIEAHGRPGEGATFTVHLPLRQGESWRQA